MKNKALLLCLLSSGLALVYIVALGLQPKVKAVSTAAPQVTYWEKIWPTGEIPVIKLGTDTLPPQLPGPADAWAGGTNHTIRLTFQVEPGRYKLRMSFFDSHNSAPPLLTLSLNGKRLIDIQTRAGGGTSQPYDKIRDDLALSVDVPATGGPDSLEITSVTGSWIAPAEFKLTRGREFVAAKSAYLLLASRGRMLILIALLACTMFSAALIRRSPGVATALTILAVLSFALAFVVAELGYRQLLIRHPKDRSVSAQGAKEQKGTSYTYETMIQPNPDPAILYELKPNLDGFFGGHPLKSNSLGMRGPETSTAKSPGVMRILGLGDSVMFGWAVSYEDTALTRVGRELALLTGRPVESLNTACPSYNTAVEVATYRTKCRRYKPDVVVVIFMENDLGFPGLMLEPVYPFTLSRSYIAEQLRKKLACRWKDAERYEQTRFVSTRHIEKIRNKKAGDLNSHDQWIRTVQAYYTKMTGIDAVAAYLKELSAMLKEDGALGIVVYNCIRCDVDNPATYEKHGPEIVKLAKAAGLEAVDMRVDYENYMRTNNIKRMEDGLWVSKEDWHPNAEGHRMIAEAVLRILEGKEFVKRK
ncbi:MAG: SGNH/GDSL hydrolase family protein [bacterium]